MYISSVPFEDLKFPKLGTKAPPEWTEPIQHGVFKNFLPPLALYAFLGGIMHLFRPERKKQEGKES